MKVDDLMTKNVITVHMDDRLEHVRHLFTEHKFHHLLVVDDNKELAAVLSDRDLLKAISPHLGLASETSKDVATLNKRVHQVAARKPLTLTAGSQFAEAVTLFHEQKISCIPIVNESQKPVGIITVNDIVHALYQKVIQKNVDA